MASNGNDRGGLLTAGGILSIVAGVCDIAFVCIMMVSLVVYCQPPIFEFWPFTFAIWPIPTHPSSVSVEFPIWFIIMEGLLLVLGIVAIIGGISAIRRKSFGLSLAGAICALPSGILGVLAIIFVSLGKREFRAKD
jgi:hypothetical protein